MNIASIVAGGHVRVGLEDNIYYDLNKRRLATNATLVNRIKKIADELERPISTAQQSRETLGL